jgi:hypothetical protein
VLRLVVVLWAAAAAIAPAAQARGGLAEVAVAANPTTLSINCTAEGALARYGVLLRADRHRFGAAGSTRSTGGHGDLYHARQRLL